MNHVTIGKYISSIYRHQAMVVNHLLKDLNIGSGQYLFLIKVTENPGLTQKVISELLHIDRANTNRALKKLESCSYIKTTADPQDKRNKRSYTTPEGEVVYIEVKKRLKEVSSILKAGLSEEALFHLEPSLIQMEQNIQNCVQSLKE